MRIHAKNIKEAVERIYTQATHKTMFSNLLLHAYDSSRYNCNMQEIMHYINSEPSESTLKSDVFAVLEMMQMGIETHDVIGRERIERLMM